MKVAVVGAGPGGATAALVLARGGADVTVHLPAAQTEKPCGGALPGREADCAACSVDRSQVGLRLVRGQPHAAAGAPNDVQWFDSTHSALPGVALKAMWTFLRNHLDA